MTGVTSLYIGRPGTALLSLPCPAGGMEKGPDKFGRAQQLLGGGWGADFSMVSTRTWSMDFPYDDTAWHQLHALYTWQYGPGPFAMLEPTITNYLSPNQASGTDAKCNTDGFTIFSGTETISSSSVVAYSGARCLKWDLPASVVSGILRFEAPFQLTAYPIPPLSQWTLSCQLQGGNTDPTFQVTGNLRFLDSAGGTLSTATGSPVTTAAGSWQQLAVTGTAPSNAVYVRPFLTVSAGTVTNVATCYVDGAQLQVGAAATAWKPGEGMPIVSFAESPKEVVAWANSTMGERRNVSVKLVQLGGY